MNKIIGLLFILGGVAGVAGVGVASAADEALEAVTANGDRVLLRPSGRWEYVDADKALVAKRVADEHPDNKGMRPAAQQGCLFGIGRCLMPGDKDYNRGTLNPAKR